MTAEARGNPFGTAPRPGSKADGTGISQAEAPTVTPVIRCIADWAGRDPPERRWIIPDWIPRQQVTGLYGQAGCNKTDFLLQLLMAASLGLPFIGHQLAAVPAFGLFCEDTEAEMHLRAARTAAHYGRDLSDFADCYLIPLVGVRLTEFVTFDNGELLPSAPLFQAMEAIRSYHAGLVVLDTMPDFFGGREIDRREIAQFFRMLDAISMQNNCAIVYSAHPSVRGLESGEFDSGSTGWNAKVRARLSLHDPGPDDEDEDERKERQRLKQPAPSTDRRILVRRKSNYARQGVTIELTCRDGFFLPAAVDPQSAAARGERGPMRDAAVDERYMVMINRVKNQGQYVHDVRNAPDRYAPRVFAQHPDGKQFSEAEYRRAMLRLLAAGRIRLEEFGPKSRPLHRLVIVEPQ